MATEEVPGQNENADAEGIVEKLSVIGKEAEDLSEAELLEALHRIAEASGKEFVEEPEENERDMIEKAAAEGWRFLGRLADPKLEEKELVLGDLRMERGLILKRDE